MSIRIACAFDEAGLTAFERESQPGAVDILVLPELFDGGYRRLHQDKGQSPHVTAVVDRFQALSNQHRFHLVAGSIALTNGDGVTRNTSLLYSHGNRIAEFSKTHLFRPLGDDQFFAPGQPMMPIALDCRGIIVRTGVVICYDLRFPEIVRPWFKAGLDLLVVPARWPRVRDDIWRLLLRARAVENQCFVVGVNARDDEGGGSYAFGPDGRSLFDLGPDSAPGEMLWYKFEIDLAEIARVKVQLDTRPDARLL